MADKGNDDSCPSFPKKQKEMKATELMIGDRVRVKMKVIDTESNPIRYKWDYRKIDVSYFHRLYEGYDDFQRIEPIPLTPEILEKNGFVNDSSYDECVADGCFVTIQIWSYNTENVFISWDGITCNVVNDFGCPCEKIELHGLHYEHDIYVHQLQHALRLCGLNELADNFKV